MRNNNRVASGSHRRGRTNDSKKNIIIVAAIAVVVLICFFTYKSCMPEQHKLPFDGVVQSVNSDGTLKLTNGLTVEILGISLNGQTVQWLRENLVGKSVVLTADSHDSKPYYVDASKDKVRAYVTVTNANVSYTKVDGYLLANNLAILNNGYCQDSLEVFIKYANSIVSSKDLDGSTASVSGKTLTKQELFKLMAPATFLVQTVKEDGSNAIGTGFFINENGLALTNYHVLASAERGNVFLCDENGNITPDRDRNISRVVQYSSKYDWCIFVVALDPGEKSPYLNLARTRPEIGVDVGVVGNPQGLLATYTTGSVTNLHEQAGKIQVDASMTQGNSGGPICNFQGEVVAIAQSVLGNADGSNATGNINFGTDIMIVRDVLDQLKDVKTYGGK